MLESQQLFQEMTQQRIRHSRSGLAKALVTAKRIFHARCQRAMRDLDHRSAGLTQQELAAAARARKRAALIAAYAPRGYHARLTAVSRACAGAWLEA